MSTLAAAVDQVLAVEADPALLDRAIARTETDT